MSRVFVSAILATVLVAGTVGCSASAITYVDEDATYDQAQVFARAGEVDPGELAEAPASETAALRRDALVALRRQGEGGAEAASLITRTFPTETAGVPFYVESATYDSVPAVIIFESIGRTGGNLSDVRVWVIGLDGDVLLSGTR